MKARLISKKLFSLFLVLILTIVSVPVALAAVETLSANNVTQWPTITYKTEDGVIHYGQTFSEAVIINDDEIVLDAMGNQVAGHFEFFTPNQRPTSTPETGTKLNIKFVPDDTTAYKGFTKVGSSIMYVVVKTTLLLVDSNDLPVTSSKIEKGGTLSSLAITGGQVYNPYYAGDTKAAGAYWEWVNPDTVVTESGEFEAILHTAGGSYEPMTRMVYVEVESSIEATKIVEVPTATLEYGQYWSELVLEGGKVMAGDTEVSGTFVLKSMGDTKADVIGVYDYIQVSFTPDDLEKYAPCEGTATVTVTKANYKFVNENGEVIVPELTLPYGTTFNTNDLLGNSLKAFIKDYDKLSGVDIVGSLIFEAGDKDTLAPVGTNTYNVRIRPYNSGTSNYNVTDLQFILTIEPLTVDMTLSMSIDVDQTINIKTVKFNDPYPQGTFDIYVDGVLYMEAVKGSFPFDPGKSGEYEIKMVYNPVENDPCIVEEKTTTWTEIYHRKLTKGDLVMGGSPSVMCGKEVTLSANMLPENFGGWKITDANGNEITLEGAVMVDRDITFAMPDFDIKVEAIDNSASSGGNGNIDDIFGDLGDLTEGDSDNIFENIINNLVAFFKNIIETIKNFFRGIGDLT